MKFTRSLVPCLLTMAIVSYCGPEAIRRALVSIFRNSLRKCRSNWNAFWILSTKHLGCILTIDSTENCLAECSFRFIYIQHWSALGWIFGDGRAVGSDGLRVACNRLYFQGGNREFDKTICWCDCRRNWKWLQPLTTAVIRRWWESRLTLPVHNIGQCWLSWWVCARLRKAASRIVGFVQISRSWKDFAVQNGKFVLTANSIKTSRTRAKTWLILLGKQFRSVTQPHDKRDTESRRSADLSRPIATLESAVRPCMVAGHIPIPSPGLRFGFGLGLAPRKGLVGMRPTTRVHPVILATVSVWMRIWVHTNRMYCMILSCMSSCSCSGLVFDWWTEVATSKIGLGEYLICLYCPIGPIVHTEREK